MVAPVLIRPCQPAELPALVALLDEEFILSKGRSISLARRFPAALAADNCRNILLACRGVEIAAAIVIRRFDWIAPQRSWRGAMIGMVYTRPQDRGRGLASQLLRRAEELLRADGTAFAVLWSAQAEFYRRLGWTSADCGVLGTYTSSGGGRAACSAADAGTIDVLRLRGAAARMPRSAAAYRALPLPAERVELLAGPNGESYAIHGVQAERAYIYELRGAPSGFPLLWQDICAGLRTVYINERRGSAAQQWLSELPGISWREPALAMWLPLAEADCARHFGDWYLPYLDRI